MTRARRHVALIGLRCSGKTTTGNELAQLLGARFVDLDLELLRAANASTGSERFASTGDVLSTWGEPTFRSLETQVLRDVLEAREGCVLATGGGVVLAARNRARLAQYARCIWMRVDLAELDRRLRADPTPRPALLGNDLVEELAELAEQRAPLYAESADWTLECGLRAPRELAASIAEWLMSNEEKGSGA